MLLTEGYFSECLEKRNEVIKQMNDLLKKMLKNEYKIQKANHIQMSKEYQRLNFPKYALSNSDEIKKEEEERKELEQFMKESEEKERVRWKDPKYKYGNEKKRKRYAMVKNIINVNEMETLQNVLDRNFDSVIFDSETDDWSMEHSTFASKMGNRSHFLILIETTEGKRFGCYIENQVKEVGKYVEDSNATIYKFKGDLIEMYQVKDRSYSFIIRDEK